MIAHLKVLPGIPGPGQGCTKEAYNCHLGEGSISCMVEARGVETAKVLFVGDAPARDDDRMNRAFHGPNGKTMSKLCNQASLPLRNTRFTNVVRCIPWDWTKLNYGKPGVRSPTEDEVHSCIGYLYAEIERVDPKVIIPLGASALLALTGKKGILKQSGRRFDWELPRSWRLLKWIQAGVDVPQEFREFTLADCVKYLGKTEKQKEKVLAILVTNGVPEDVTGPGKTWLMVPTLHPAALLRGNQAAEAAILGVLNIARSHIDGKDLVPTAGYRTMRTLNQIKSFYDMLLVRFRAGELSRISLDVETNGWDSSGPNPFLPDAYGRTREALCWGISWAPERAVLIPFRHPESPFVDDPAALAAIRAMTNNLLAEIPVTNHSIMFDATTLEQNDGIYIRHIQSDPRALAAWLHTDTLPSRELEDLANRMVGMFSHKHEMVDALAKGATKLKTKTKTGRTSTTTIPATMASVPLELHERYCCADADAALRLTEKLEAEVVEAGADVNQNLGGLELYRKHMIETIPAGMEIVLAGTQIDRPRLESAVEEVRVQCEGIRAWFTEFGLAQAVERILKERGREKPFNLNATEHQGIIIHDLLQTPVVYKSKKTDAPSMARDTLESYAKWWLEQAQLGELSHQNAQGKVGAIKKILEWKLLSKQFGTYLKPLPAQVSPDGRIHWEMNVCSTATGRWAAFFHTLPKDSAIKDAIISRWPGGLILNADLSQIEMRLGAVISGDEKFKELIRSGVDMHTGVAAEICHHELVLRDLDAAVAAVTSDERRVCKAVGFGVFYGQSADSLAMAQGITIEAAEEYIEGFFSRFPQIRSWAYEQNQLALERGYIACPTGWRRKLQQQLIDHDPTMQIERLAKNTPVQNAASFWTHRALVGYRKRRLALGLKSPAIGFTHDSITTDVHPGELHRLLPALHKELVLAPYREWPWVDVPVKADFEIGARLGQKLKLSWEGQDLTLVGSPEHWEETWSLLQQWDPCPNLVSLDVLEEKGTKKVTVHLRQST